MRRGAAIAMAGGVLAAAPVAAVAAVGDARPAAWVLVAAVAAHATLEALAAPRSDRSGDRVDAALSLATALALLAIAIAAAATASTGALAVTSGALVFAAGVALRVAAIRALGERFTSWVRVAPVSDLATAGLYGRMRHPSELGLLLIGGGAALMTASWIAASIATLVLAPLVAVRIRREDRQLAAVFGDHHAAYRRRVGRLARLGSHPGRARFDSSA